MIISWLVVAMVLAMVAIPACSAAPPPFARLDLNQTQTYRNLTISSLETVDLMDLSVSRVTLYSTVGDDSDTKTIPFPGIRDIRRVFSSNIASWHGNTLTILGGTDTTVSGAGFEDYTFFIDRYVPVVQCEVPLASGDVLLVQANTTSRNHDFRTLVESLERMYLLHTKGIAGIQRKSGGGWTITTVGGPWNIDPDNIDFGKVLLENEVALTNFLLDRDDAQDISTTAGMPPAPGDYILSAVEYFPPPTGKVITYAAWPVLITDGDNRLDLVGMSKPYRYNKRSGSDLTLTFQDPSPVKNLTYLLVRQGETYDATIRVNMTALEEAGGSISPEHILSGNPFLTILRETGLGPDDFKKVVSYSIFAVGNSTPPHSTHFSKINITPGYGTSGYALHASQVTIPSGDLQGLLDGTFSLYALGADSNNTVVALDYDTIQIGSSPVANFTATPLSGPAPLTVTFTDLSTGTSPMTYQWNFGDGSPNSTGINPIHIYNSPGLYNVTLTVTNDFGSDTEQKVQYINVTPAPTPTPTPTGTPTPTPTIPPLQADFTADPTSGFVPLTVQFTDTSTGPHDTWSWTFGDGGSSTAQNPSHIYTSVGTYTVSLTVRQGTGTPSTRTKTNYITVVAVPPPPVAQFTANVTSGPVPLTVRFNDLSSGSIYEWIWTFGDGGTSTERDPVHTYTTPGNYTVSLRVRGLGGIDTETKTNYISAFGVPPIANFIANVTSGEAPLPVQFSDLSTGGPTAWSWTFGDGGISTMQNPVHVYHYAGNYTVTLTVANDYGTNTMVRTRYINVTGLTPPPPGLHADFAGAPRSGFIPLTVLFADASTGEPTSWNWSFGDGTYSDEQNPVHTYSDAGGFTVALTVSNGTASDTITKTDYIIASRRGGGGGGGGGGGAYIITGTPTPTPTATPTPAVTPSGPLPLGPDGRTTQPVTIVSSDGRAALSIGTGIAVTCEEGLPPTTIDISPVSGQDLPALPGDPAFMGYAYAVSPDCTLLDPGAILSLQFTTEEWTELASRDLVLMRFNPATRTWIPLPTTVDQGRHTVSAPITHGGIYGLFAWAPKGTPVPTETTAVPTTPAGPEIPVTLVAIVIVVIVVAAGAAVYLLKIRPGSGGPPE